MNTHWCGHAKTHGHEACKKQTAEETLRGAPCDSVFCRMRRSQREGTATPQNSGFLHNRSTKNLRSAHRTYENVTKRLSAARGIQTEERWRLLMIRTKVVHSNTPKPYRAAIIEAYKWVAEEGGTLIFDLMSRKGEAASILAGSIGKLQVRNDLQSKRVRIGVARGQHYVLVGPRIAIFDGSNTDMSRIETLLDDEYYDSHIAELRSFTMTVDTHPKWTNKYAPIVIDRSSNQQPRR